MFYTYLLFLIFIPSGNSWINIVETMGQIKPTSCFCKVYELRMAFIFSNGWRKINGRIFLWHLKIIWYLNFTVHNKVSLEYSHTHLFIYYLWLLSQQNWVVSLETTWPTKSKMFTIWLFAEKVTNLYYVYKLPSGGVISL